MAYMDSMKTACQSAASQAQDLLSQANSAIGQMVSAASTATYITGQPDGYKVTTTLPDLPSINTDLGIDPAALANELSKLSPELPGAYQAILNEHFPAEDFTTLEAQFEKFLSPEFLDAQRAQAVGRMERELTGKRRALVESFSDRGFSTAPGALLGMVAELESADHDKTIEMDQQLYTQNLERWFELSKFLVDSYLKAKMAEINAFVKLTDAYIRNFIELRLRGTELVTEIAKAEANLRLAAFSATAERARLSVQLEQIKLGAWEATSRERIQYSIANVGTTQQSTSLRTHALGAAAQQYTATVGSLLGANMSVMVAQGIGND